jgi:Uma2 family endonuclease
MVMPNPANEWTADMVRALPDDGKKYEVVDGELFVSPAPRPLHALAIRAFTWELEQYVRANDLGTVISSVADYEFDPKSLVEPDIFVSPFRAGPPPRDWPDAGPLRLVIEVLSPSSVRADRIVKRGRYQRAGIPEYWVIDADARRVERWRPGDERPEVLTERLHWHPEAARSPLEIDLSAFFEQVLGETLSWQPDPAAPPLVLNLRALFGILLGDS